MATSKNLRTVKDYEKEAWKILPEIARSFFWAGADKELAVARNIAIFDRFLIEPRYLRDVSRIDLSTRILGGKCKIDFPICISPSAYHVWAHPDAEKCVTRAAEKHNVVCGVTCYSYQTPEQIDQAAPNGQKWLTTLLFEDTEIKRLVEKAEKCGFSAIIVTVDTQLLSHRTYRIDSGYRHIAGQENTWSSQIDCSVSDTQAGNASKTWNDFKRICQMTKLPVIAKGVITVHDAFRAVECGAQGVIVSNHGGRNLDSVFAPLEVLPSIVAAIGDRVDVFVDGGVRTGSDVFKCLALGAKAVFIGRPAVWGLSVNGEHGVYEVLQILKNELENVMGLSGCTKIEDIKPEFIKPETYYLDKLSAKL